MSLEPAATPKPDEPGTAKASAGAAGIGGGTLLVLVADSLSEASGLKPWLLWASPTFSVTTTAIWFWLQRRVVEYAHEREARGVVDDARRTLEQALMNSQTSEEHHKRIRADLEKLERLEVARKMKRVESSITVITGKR